MSVPVNTEGIRTTLRHALPVLNKHVPEYGLLKSPIRILFEVEGCFIRRCSFIIHPDYSDQMTHRRLSIAAQFPGEGREMSLELRNGTKADLLCYLATNACVEQVVSSILELDAAIRIHD